MTLCRPFMGRLFLLDEFVTRFDDEAVDGDGERGNVFFIVQNLAISVMTADDCGLT